MKITIESKYGKSVVEDIREGLNIYEMMDLIERVLLADGYALGSVKNGFISKVEKYEENN